MRPVCLAIAVLSWSGSLAIGHEKKVRTISVVKNLPELLKQEPIQLDNQITLRLGIEDTEGPRWSGVFIYAYTEGFDDDRPRDISRDTLGPVTISTSLGGKSFDSKGTHRFQPRYQTEYNRRKKLLFCRNIIIHEHGDYRIRVRREKGEVLAEVTVRGTDNFFHPWMPFLLRSDAVHERIGSEYRFRRTKLAVAENLQKGIALPQNLGDQGLRLVDQIPKTFSPFESNLMVLTQDYEKSLPVFLPRQASHDFRLEFDAKSEILRIVPKEQIMTARPDLYFLSRWWVNEEPFIPEYTDEIRRELNEILAFCDDDVSMKFKVDPKKLGAKSGDTVDLQLLYCPGGWTRAHPVTGMGSGLGFAVMTNRIRFKLP
jgi:hypothetical protein